MISELVSKRAEQIKEWGTSPRMMVLRDFLSDEDCEHLIALGRSRIKPSTTVDPETGELILVDSRTSSGSYFTLGETPTVVAIEQRISELSGLPVENGEGMQILNYQVGQGYLPHFDYFDPALRGSATVLAYGGQRVMTCLMYLNNVESGGETHFPEIDKKVTPVRGDALVFYNVLPDGAVDPMSLHASLPMLAGEKWVATKWIRERAYRAPE
jgi:prolyl 4-hydroxylase